MLKSVHRSIKSEAFQSDKRESTDLRLDCQVEGSFLKRQQVTSLVSCSLWENPQTDLWRSKNKEGKAGRLSS